MKCRAYLDIETTGLNYCYSDITVIGIALEKSKKCHVVQLIENDLYEKKLLDSLEGVDEIYTYNGSRFDLPFIKTRLGIDLNQCFKHTDLMYDCWKHNLKGGLKVVEKLLDIKRKLTNVDGYVAVRLWFDYVNDHNKQALRSLLDYNQEDVVNLRFLRRKLKVE
ncbi:MAG: ribonuclease H-like domain-containing protein [Sedimentisphaerales bacterium]|nr:ribonuclease H-like domain-containing protein [Sedimentisphaerales bacterium]